MKLKNLNLCLSYKNDSVISQLNKNGEIHNYPNQFREPEIALRFSKISNGAFDITVQPLWKLYKIFILIMIM